jgi:nitrogen regulatory protein P-II 1
MKLITIMVEQASVEGLSAALPKVGVSSVKIGEVARFERDAVAVEAYRGAKVAKHTRQQFRVELLVEDHAVDYVMAGLSFAVSAGMIGQCKGAWITPAQELVELSSAAERLVGA